MKRIFPVSSPDATLCGGDGFVSKNHIKHIYLLCARAILNLNVLTFRNAMLVSRFAV